MQPKRVMKTEGASVFMVTLVNGVFMLLKWDVEEVQTGVSHRIPLSIKTYRLHLLTMHTASVVCTPI